MIESSENNVTKLDDDQEWMKKAIGLAKRGLGYVEPNPMVGCILVRDGKLIGEGYHQHFGGPHAEIEALSTCTNPIEATAYVTLEPCCHHGKTPPCSDALIKAGVSRVVIAMRDPYSEVDGGGIQQLREAGIKVEIGLCEQEARQVNRPFIKRVITGKPWVIAKWAMTVDGRIATTIGESQWITGDKSRRDVHRRRGCVDAIAVGMGTVVADDPLLTARPAGPRSATRVVFCEHRLPSRESKLVQTAHETPVLLITSPSVSSAKLDEVSRLGVEVIEVAESSRQDRINEALCQLGKRSMTNIIIEGGGELLGSFRDANAIDQYEVYVGAKVFGGSNAPGPISGIGHTQIGNVESLKLLSIDRLGEDDVKLTYSRALK